MWNKRIFSILLSFVLVFSAVRIPAAAAYAGEGMEASAGSGTLEEEAEDAASSALSEDDTDDISGMQGADSADGASSSEDPADDHQLEDEPSGVSGADFVTGDDASDGEEPGEDPEEEKTGDPEEAASSMEEEAAVEQDGSSDLKEQQDPDEERLPEGAAREAGDGQQPAEEKVQEESAPVPEDSAGDAVRNAAAKDDENSEAKPAADSSTEKAAEEGTKPAADSSTEKAAEDGMETAADSSTEKAAKDGMEDTADGTAEMAADMTAETASEAAAGDGDILLPEMPADGVTENVPGDASDDGESIEGDYFVDIRSTDGHIVICPGEEVVLEANARRWTPDAVIYDGFMYKWEIVSIGGTGYGNGSVRFKDDIEGRIGDYPTATLEFSGDPDMELCDQDEAYFEYSVTVKVTVYEGTDGDGNWIERVSGEYSGITLKDEYFEITPHYFDQLRIGESVTLPFKILYYSHYLPGKYGEVYDVSWSFEYDDAVLELTDAEGNKVDPTGETAVPAAGEETPVTIRRIAQGTSIGRVTANFNYIDHNGTVHGEAGSLPAEHYGETFRYWALSDSEYPVRFEQYEVEFASDADPVPALVLETDGLGADWQDVLDLAVTAGHWDHENEVFADRLDESAYAVTSADGAVRITLTEDYLEQAGALAEEDHVRFYLDVYQKGAAQTEENRISRTDGWFRIHPAGSSHSGPGESCLWTGEVEPRMEVGQEQAVVCEIRSYPGTAGAEYDVLDGVTYYWHYDDRAVRVYDENGVQVGNENDAGLYNGSDASTGGARTFAVYRRRQFDTEINLEACWTDEQGEERRENRSFHLEEREYRVLVDDMGDDRVYSDGSRSFPVRPEGLPDGAVYGTDYLVETTVGIRGGEEFEETFTEGVDYAFDGQDLTIYGEKLAARGLQDGRMIDADLLLSVKSTRSADGWESVWVEECGFRFCEARFDYDRERDRDLLPGWDGSVSGSYECRIENSEHPDGENVRYRVLNVEVVRDEPWEGESGKVITDFHRDQNGNDENDYWWYYRAGHCGEADLKVTYEDLDGREQSYVFTLHVGKDVYSVYMDSTGRERNALPGGAIELFAAAEHDYVDENGDHRTTSEGMGYAWAFEYGNEFADLEVHPDDPSKATLRFHDLPEGQDWIDGDVRVGVRVLDAQGSETGGYDSTGFRLCCEYREVWPLLLDRNMEVGAAFTDQRFETRRYEYGRDGYTVLDDIYDVRYEWYHDENAFLVTENRDGTVVELHNGDAGSGNTFTIFRRGSWDAGFSIRAVWTDGEGREQDAWTNHQVLRRDFDLQFEEHDIDLYTDAAEPAGLVLDTGNLGEGWQDRFDLVLTAGRWDDGWKDLLPESAYTVTETDGAIRAAITKAYLDSVEDYENLRFAAELYLKGAEHNDENRLCDTDAWLHIKKARIEYDREWDRDLLPGWDGSVNGSYDCRVENSEHPDGENVRCRVLDVEVVRDEPWEGEDGKVLPDFHRDQSGQDENDYWWYYRAGARGEAVLKVTYEDINGEEQSYEFTLRVGGDVYNVRMDSEGGVENVLPGQAVELFAQAGHDYVDENGEHRYTEEGMGYAWSFEYGGEFADLEVHADDPSRATLRFHGLPEGQDRIDEEVRVGVRVLDGPVNGNETGGYDAMNLWVRSEYTEIWPLVLDCGLDVGAAVADQKFEVRRYETGRDGYEVLKNVRYQWKNVDENAVRITENRDGAETVLHNDETAAGDTFTITRRRGWWTEYTLRAIWDEDGGERDAWANYRFDEKHYNDVFENEDDDINDDEEKTFALDARTLGNFGGEALLFVNYRAADRAQDLGDRLDGLTENVDYIIDEDGAVYINMTGEEFSYGSDGRSVLVNGDRVERVLRTSVCEDDRFRNEFYIGAFLNYEGETLSSSWCRVTLHRTGKSVQELTADDVAMTLFDSQSIAVDGAKGGLSFTSSDENVVKVGQDGALTPAGYGTATVTIRAAATADYRIGVKKIKVTIGKLSLAKVKVTTNAPAKGYTYNGRAQKPSTVTVTYNGHTFVSGTDYTVTYPSDVKNAGTKTVTVTAKGKDVTGTKKVTYKINKAEQTLAVKTGSSAALAAAAADTASTITVPVKGTVYCAVTGSQGALTCATTGNTYAKVTATNQTKKVTAVQGVKVGAIKLKITSAATANYNEATIQVALNVVPAATTKLTAQNLATGMKLTWAKVAGATGYYVYRGSTKIATITKNATVTYTDKKANTNGTKYVFKIVPYATLNKKAAASTATAKTLTAYRVSRPAISSAVNTAGRKMTVKWAKNAKATGYQIQYSLTSDFSSPKKVTIGKAATVSTTITGLTKNKTYYVRICTLKKVGTTTYTSAWSAAKTVKITK